MDRTSPAVMRENGEDEGTIEMVPETAEASKEEGDVHPAPMRAIAIPRMSLRM